MLVHHAREGRTRVYDFFVSVPGHGARRDPGPMQQIDVVFEGDSTQVFNIGPPTVAVPGDVARARARLIGLTVPCPGASLRSPRSTSHAPA